jgi:hypothetical protein
MGDGVAKMETPAFMPGRTSIRLSAQPTDHVFIGWGGCRTNLQLYMSPEAEHILDWWHVSQKLTILDQYGKGLVHCDPVLGESIRDKIDRLK